ncbi:DUF6630 family protein [Cohnella terricola]|uniref:DUF6630 domain-containing protein n=1 Tax=Cohnella terricola TaxID=1289167 RepID=A0A559JQA7_9BACL|nr:DUF6630 family protein [Cohnella terricola]TVY02072.1 hypothetical protein FPZ45_06415 [Cohnella terricola]
MNKSAFLLLSEKLSYDSKAIVLEDVTLAVEHPDLYMEKYQDRLEERGIDEPVEELAWISLVDVLIEHKLAFEVDWKATGIYVCDVVDILLHRKKISLIDWEEFEDEDYSDMPSDQFFQIVANKLSEVNLALTYLDIDSDCYVLIVVPIEDMSEIKRLAQEAEVTIGEF